MKTWIMTTADGWEPTKCIMCGVFCLYGRRVLFPKREKCPLGGLKPVITLEEYQKANPKRPTGNKVQEIYIVDEAHK